MVTKTEVITIRCSKEEKDLIVKGAEEEHKTISGFIIGAARFRRSMNSVMYEGAEVNENGER